MRRFFRFSIRDLLWLTLAVAMALGWWLREGQFNSKLQQANKWRGVVGAMEYVMREHGWQAEIDFDLSRLEMTNEGPVYSTLLAQMVRGAKMIVGFREPA